MTGISKVSEKLKKKMSFSDYAVSEEAPKEQHPLKTTVYLPEAVNRMLNEIYSTRSKSDLEADKLSLICEAIRLLYKKEKK